MKYLYSFIVIFLLCACSKENTENPLELTILNESLNAYQIKDSLHGRILIGENEYKSIAKNSIQFKIENKSSKIYLLVIDNNAREFFPEYQKSIGFENFLFFDEDGNPPRGSNSTAGGKEEFYNYLIFRDSIQKNYYSNIGYQNKSVSWWSINNDISRNLIKIHPKEILYFETYSYLPYHWNSLEGNFGGAVFDYKKNYHSKLEFNFKDLKYFKNFLTELQKKEINENNYAVFSGELISINQVPVKFVD